MLQTSRGFEHHMEQDTWQGLVTSAFSGHREGEHEKEFWGGKKEELLALNTDSEWTFTGPVWGGQGG